MLLSAAVLATSLNTGLSFLATGRVCSIAPFSKDLFYVLKKAHMTKHSSFKVRDDTFSMLILGQTQMKVKW